MDESRGAANDDDIERERPYGVDPVALEAAVLREQVRILDQAPAILPANLINAAITAYILRNFYPAWLILAWLALFVIVISARLYDSWRYRREPQSNETASNWARRFAIGTTLTGCLWGLSGSVVLLTPDPTYHAFIAFVLGGMTAGAVARDSAHLPATIGFVTPTILPAILAFFIRAELISIAMGLMLAAFATVLAALAYRTNHWIKSVSRRGIIQTTLTAALEYRNKLLHAVSIAATELTSAATIDEVIPELLEIVGETIGVDRVPLFELRHSTGVGPAQSLLYVWQSTDASVAHDANSFARKVAQSGIETDTWLASLRELKPVFGLPRTMNAGAAKTLFESLGILSILIVPIVVDEKYWGLIAFDDCKREREWKSVEIDALRILADMIGSSITRQRYLEQLKDANAIVERSPTILYRLRGEPALPLIYISRNIASFGYSQAEMIASPQLYKSHIHPDDEEKVQRALARVMTAGSRAGAIEFRYRRSDGVYRWLDCHYAPIRDAAGKLVQVEGILIDITERKEADEQIALLARTDSLTGLANRGALIDSLRKAFAAAKRGANPFALLYLDLDHFKDINDTLGHPTGDTLLKAVAERLKENCRESDVVARLGGDEFAIIQTEISDLSDATTLASKIHNVLGVPYPLRNSELRVTVSIGISPYTSETPQWDSMLTQADLALYRAKEEGRDKYCFHSEDLDRAVRERITLTEDLRLALTRNELELYYQPQIKLATNQIVGMEALIRWNHPKRGLLMPADFIPVVEKTGVDMALGEWVLDHAFEQMSSWRKAGIAPQTCAINLSLGQIRVGDEFFAAVTKSLTKWSLAPKDLELDVTESMLAYITWAQSSVLSRLSELGVAIGIDDFGTQYSSLDYLKTYRVSRITIPRSVIDAATRDPNSLALVRSIMALARELNIEIVAKGVETEAQRALLTAAPSTTTVQGFYFSEPVPAGRATELLRRGLIEH
jgi:diguanylate cyclase (GGDEF)-like protein/PAS domain S-box-containing protein